MLNVSATQEIYRRLLQEQLRNKQLQQELETLKTQHESRLESIETHLGLYISADIKE